MFVCLKGHIRTKSLKQHKMLIRNTEVYSTIEDKIVSSVRGFIIKQHKSILFRGIACICFSYTVPCIGEDASKVHNFM